MYLFSIVLWSACLYMQLSPFSLCFVSFAALRCFERNVFEFLRDCFVWLVQTLGFGCFLQRVFFLFCASFTYLELFYLRYFSDAVFLSACLHLRYHSVFRRMRFSQLIHFMLQLVEGFSFPSILSCFMDDFHSILLFCVAYSLSWSPVTNC